VSEFGNLRRLILRDREEDYLTHHLCIVVIVANR